ncbi:MAG: phosphoglycolate phosphatase [Gammaproteobacteria bacterium]
MALKKPELVLFDLDGTLVDSSPDLAYSADSMLERLGMPRQGEAHIRNWIGSGIERLVKRALTGAMHAEPEPDLFQKAMPIFLEIYEQNACVLSRCYEGVVESLAYLKKNDYRTACVTNKAGRFTRILLQSLGIHDDFDIVICGDTLAKKKPDPMPLLHAAEHFNVTPDRSLMVGDSVNDVEAARAAGFQILCVTYGYNLGRDIRAANPDAVVDTLNELPSLLDAIGA